MKRTILFLAAILITSGAAFAQSATISKPVAKSTAPAPSAQQVTPVKQAGAALAFEKESHDFGTVAEGPSVSYDFIFTNKSDKPIKLESVRASCGCTATNWPREEIQPGESSKITATYTTKNRPNGFQKTITVTSTVGQKYLTIKGNVEKAPTSSVPTNNNSMIKH